MGEVKGAANLPAFKRMFGWTDKDSKVTDDCGRAGIFSKAMISEYRAITDKLLENLPDHESPNPAASLTKFVPLKRK